ncbi:MAG: 4Fe-4S dicluster domain-containing protein, partial [Chloroflexota bacterium]|nr:4Fe-4S dicluster domain-containing protein [Chloroflexota bacterium]
MIRGIWQVTDKNTLGAVREFLRSLLDKKIVDALLVPMEGAHNSVMPALVKNAARLDRANPFAPVMTFNSARLVSMLTRDTTNAKIGVVLRSCEIRALIELVKFNQAKLDHAIIIGVDCFGTFAVPEYASALQGAPDLVTQMFTHARDASANGFAFRSACAICEHPAPSNADISIGFIGIDNTKALAVDMRDDIAEKMGVITDASVAAERDAALASLVATRMAQRDTVLKTFRAQIKRDGMASYFADCLECTNCMNACPICYCKECFFRTANAEHAPRELLRSAERAGALTMPPDALLFQITRLNHMATSCVGCGMCEAACPHDIPLTAMFRAVGARVQKEFDYVPGRDVNEKPPFMEFKRD